METKLCSVEDLQPKNCFPDKENENSSDRKTSILHLQETILLDIDNQNMSLDESVIEKDYAKSKMDNEPVHRRQLPTPWLAQLSHNCTYPLVCCIKIIFEDRRTIIDILLFYVLPAAWVALLLLCIHSGAELVSTLHLPLVGMAGALAGNVLPIGSGVVYLPLMVKLIDHDSIHASVEFSLAVGALGGGVWGLLFWTKRDEQQKAHAAAHGRVAEPLILWHTMQYTVPACWLGTAMGILGEPELPVKAVSGGFSLFCMVLAGYLVIQISRNVRIHQTRIEHAYSRNFQGLSASARGAPLRGLVASLAWLPPLLDWGNDISRQMRQHAHNMLQRLMSIGAEYDVVSMCLQMLPSGREEGSAVPRGYQAVPNVELGPDNDEERAVRTEYEAELLQCASEVPRRQEHPEASLLTEEGTDAEDAQQTWLGWTRVVFASFMGGLLFLPNIGAGPSLITYICLLLMGYEPQPATVTAVVTGGVACWAPFLIHAAVLQDMTSHIWAELAMALPGIALGAWIAPCVSEGMGPMLQELVMLFFLLMTVVLFAL